MLIEAMRLKQIVMPTLKGSIILNEMSKLKTDRFGFELVALRSLLSVFVITPVGFSLPFSFILNWTCLSGLSAVTFSTWQVKFCTSFTDTILEPVMTGVDCSVNNFKRRTNNWRCSALIDFVMK